MSTAVAHTGSALDRSSPAAAADISSTVGKPSRLTVAPAVTRTNRSKELLMRFGTVNTITATTTTLTSPSPTFCTRGAGAVRQVCCGSAGAAGDGLKTLPYSATAPSSLGAPGQEAHPLHSSRGCAVGR